MKYDFYYDYDCDTSIFKTLEPVYFIFKDKQLEVPVGFQSDGCSCPKFALSFCDALCAKYTHIWIIHDYGYTVHYASRKEIDQLLYDMLVEARNEQSQSKDNISLSERIW